MFTSVNIFKVVKHLQQGCDLGLGSPPQMAKSKSFGYPPQMFTIRVSPPDPPEICASDLAFVPESFLLGVLRGPDFAMFGTRTLPRHLGTPPNSVYHLDTPPNVYHLGTPPKSQMAALPPECQEHEQYQEHEEPLPTFRNTSPETGRGRFNGGTGNRFNAE